MSKSLQAGWLDRRRFIAGATAIAAAGAMPMVPARAAMPKQGGNFRLGIGHGATTDSLDPALASDTYMQTVGFGLRNCLTEIGSDDRLQAELAESWEASPDATTWTFKLRKGVTFHSGKSLDADDVIASVRHHLDPELKSPMKGLLEMIGEIKKDGSDRVTFVLNQGNADFAYLLSDYHVAIMPAKDGKADWASGDGTGGYVLQRFNPGVETQMQRFPGYWKSGRAHFDQVSVLSIIDTTARTNGLISGELDAMDRVDLKTIDMLSSSKDISIKETQGGLHYAYTMFTDASPTDNVDVRLALKYAIDRQVFLDKLLAGHGYLGNDNPIGKTYQFYDAALPQRPYDPDKARFHLKKAGLSSLEITFNVCDAAFPGAVDGSVLYSDAAAKAGIKINVNREPDDSYWSNVWNVKNFTASYWSGRVTEDWMFTTVYAKGQAWNETHWTNPRFNELLVQARSEIDPAKRRAMYAEMQVLCSDDCGAVIPAFANYVFAASTKVAHDRLSAAWDLDGIKSLERWWFA